MYSIVAGVIVALLTPSCLASAFVKGAYYRLGDADPGAAAGAVGNDPTVDSFSDGLDLARSGSPHYAADVPALGPTDNKLSMAFANIGLGGPAFPGEYGRSKPLPMIEQGMALEAWAKSGPTNLDASGTVRSEMVAYNGDPAANGFGFFNYGGNYVLQLGSNLRAAVPGPTEQILGPADVGVWHHLAYVFSFGTSSFYYDGKLVATSTTDPAPLTATDGFWVGGRTPSGVAGAAEEFGFNGWIDEVRYQTFNPIAAGAFDPTAFLITPEPGALALLAIAASAALRRRARRPEAA
jgi:hypothetical protein